jgi:glycosyltransferase involved in cell wall biosynthesis/peptidoglycan/xylan/chitin deacetylase (PgdA/CDA1 family)
MHTLWDAERMANFKNGLLLAVHLMGVNGALTHWNRGKIRVLIYHNVVPDTTAFPYALTPAEFERQIALIKKKYNPVHLDESGAIVGFAPDRINILITFDDGFINNYQYVFPILVKHGLKATFFLIVDCVETGATPVIAERYSRSTAETGTEYRTVSLSQIQEMMAAGMTFGSHTFTHTDLTQTDWAEGISIARGSAEKLGAVLGREVKLFAFPWGRYKRGQPEALAGSLGRIFTTDHGFNGLGDVVMRRDEAVNHLHMQFVVSGSRDLFSTGRKAIANACGRIAGRAPRAEAARLPGSFDQFNRSEAINSATKPKPLIAFVLPDLSLGGAEIVGAALVDEFLKRGFRADFVVGQHTEEAFALLPPFAGYMCLKAKRAHGMLFPLARYLRERRPSAVIASMWPLTVLSIVALKLAGSKARLAVCDHNALSHQYGRLSLPKQWVFKKSISLTYRFADARIAVSSGVADDLAAMGGLPRDDISVVHNPILYRPASPADRAAAEAIWRGWRGPRILTVGNLRPQKNHRLLIRVFKKVVTSRDARLLILGAELGKAEGIETMKAYAQSLGVADKVIIPGAVPNPTAYYQSANLFVLSSDHEGLPGVLIEALACGLPVVSTDCPYGPAEILAGGRYGRLTAVGDADELARAILEALDSPHDPDALRRRAADFAPEGVAENYLRLLFPHEPALPRSEARSENRLCAE